MLFKVKCSSFREKGVIYNRDDCVESKRDLCEAFPGKFDLLQDDPFPTRPNIATVARSPLKTAGGAATQAPPAAASKKGKKEEEVEAEAEEQIQEPSEMEEDWDDMTDEFSKAKENEFQVLFNGESYKIVDKKTNKTLKGGEGIGTPKEVRIFLKRHLRV